MAVGTKRFKVEERPKHSVVNRNPPGCQTSRRISRTSRRSSSIGCRSLMIGRRSSAGLLAWTSCQDPSRWQKKMNSENSNDDVPVEFDFRGDAAPTSMDPYCDDVISDRQQSILNELRIHFCREDLIYLNNHKEVEAIVSLLLNGILKKSPKNPYTYAASYLKNPQTAKLIANFKRFEDFQYEDILKKDYEQYATTAAAVTIAGTEQVESMVTLNEQTAVSENDEVNAIVDKYDLLPSNGETDVATDEEAEMAVSHKE